MLKRLIVCVGAVILCALPAAAKPTIGVLDFTVINKAVVLGQDFSSLTWDETETNLLSGDLITALVNTRKFDVVERDRMKDIMREKDFVSITKDRAMELGSLLGADYFVMGQIELLEAGVESRQIPYTDRVKRTWNGRMAVNVRVVDTRGGKIVSAKKVDVRHQASPSPNQNLSAMGFIETVKEKTVRQMVNGIVESVFPVKIIKVAGDEVYLNRGKGAPFEVGSILTVCEEGEQLVDPDTGEVLGAVETEVGRVQVTEMLDKFSKATIISGGQGELVEGAICRPAAAVAASEPQPRDVTPGSSAAPIQW